MLYISSNGQDITNNVDRDSIRITEQLNNRANTANFSVTDEKVEEWQQIEIREYCTLRNPFVSWWNVIDVSDTFQISDKFRDGTLWFIAFDSNQKRKVYVQSVDHNLRQVTLTDNLSSNFSVGTKFWKLLFSGIVQNAPERELTAGEYSEGTVFERSVNVSDYKHLFDRKVVAETYENMYFREIIGRIIYKFCANDNNTNLIDFETLGTSAGVVGTQTFDTVDRIQGNKSIQFAIWASGNGTATYTVAPIDIWSYDKVRFWWKIAEDNGMFMNTMKLRIGQGSSDYFERNINNIWLSFEAHRSLESQILAEPTATVGVPDLWTVTRVQFYFDFNWSTTANAIHFDLMQCFNWWFTIQNCKRGDVFLEDIRIQYKKPSSAVENIAKLTGEYWYIDYYRDLHYYGKLWEQTAPYTLTDTSQNFGEMSVDVDITNLRNRQTVRGGEAPDQLDYTQDEVSDGQEDSRRLDYKPKDLRIYVDSWSWFVQKSVWVENLVDETTVDFVYNFQEKVVRRTSVTPALNVWDIFRRVYKPYRPIRVRVQNTASIMAMKLLTWWDGIYDWSVIVEPKIKTFQEARQRAKAEIEAYKNPIVTINFKTNYDWLTTGQLLPVIDTDRWINDSYLIQKVTRSSRSGSYWTYNVTISSTLFGITEFLQLLLKRSDKWEVDASEIVDIVQNVDEVITIQDNYSFDIVDNTYYAWTIDTKHWDFRNQRYTNGNILAHKQKFMWDRFAENLGTGSYSSTNCVFENPLLQIQTKDGKPRERKNKVMLIWKELGTGALYKSHVAVDDKFGNQQGAMSFGTSGYIQIPYSIATTASTDVSILIEHQPWGNVALTDYTLLSFGGMLITANTSTIRIRPNIFSWSFNVSRANLASNWERLAIIISFNAPNSTLDVLVDWKLLMSQVFAFGPASIWYRPSSVYWWIWSYNPNVDNRAYKGNISEVQIYDRILSARQVYEWSQWYTDKAWLTLASGNASPAWLWTSTRTPYKVKPSTAYNISFYTEILDDLINDAGGGGIYFRIAEYAERREGGDTWWMTWLLQSNDFVAWDKTKHDWRRVTGVFTTTASTEWINIGCYLFNIGGVIRINDILLEEIGVETISNVWRADYCTCI